MQSKFDVREFLDLPSQEMQLEYLKDNNKEQELIFNIDTA